MIKEIEKPKIVRQENSHKGTFGTALLICGSYGMAGAAVLSTKACLKSGIGIAKLCLPKSIYEIAAKQINEAVFVPVGAGFFKKFPPFCKGKIKPHLSGASSVLIGCGMGISRENKRLMAFVLQNAECPVIIDADGLNMLSKNTDLLLNKNSAVVLTPHPKEMSRLTGKSVAEIEANREESAVDFAKKYGVYLVLKGHETIVAAPNGDTFINKTGNSGMATGGSGDTLSGILAARLAQEKDVLAAVTQSVYIHGLAGDIAAQKFSKSSMLPGDMIECLPDAFKMLEK